MSRLEFKRLDLRLVVNSREVQLSVPNRDPEIIPFEAPIPLADRINHSETAKAWRRLDAGSSNSIERVVVDIRAPALQAFPWEKRLSAVKRSQYSESAIVRVTPVRPRAASVPFTLPMRFLEINPSKISDVLHAIQNVFPRPPLERYAKAILVEQRSWSRWEQMESPENWPSVDVLHLAGLPSAVGEWMFSGDARKAGTVGGLVEILVRWQTRLLVLHSHQPSELEALQRFAAAIVARGGPAVLVEYLSAQSDRTTFYDMFYEEIIHDFPLDWCWRDGVHQFRGERPAVFAGAGREDALRVSNVASILNDIARLDPQHPRQQVVLKTFTRGLRSVDRSNAESNVRNGLVSLRDEWDKSRFEFSERQGMLPLADILDVMRQGARGFALQDLMSPSRPSNIRTPRFINSSFWVESEDGDLSIVDQKKGAFDAGQTYHLGVQVGPRDARVVTCNEAALIEEVFKWSPEMTGVWIEIGVTGIDFDVIGDPVQRLWLPREGASDIVYFAVSPRKEGSCLLRFSVYYEQNVIQSFRIAAIVGSEPSQKRSALLSKALNHRTRIDAAYMPMSEFGLAQNIDQFVATASEFAAPAISIVANDHNGESIITVKGPGDFSVNVSDALAGYVTILHARLKELSGTLDVYPFDPDNRGSLKQLERALRLLADSGFELFNELFDRDVWESIFEALEPKPGPQGSGATTEEPDRTIQVAQILREKVIPWSFIYSRNLRPFSGDRDENGDLTNMPVCLAALPSGDGDLPVRTCGASADCVINQPSPRPRTKDNVICPLAFWGFRHVVEIPPQQKNRRREQTTALGPEGSSGARNVIEVDRDVRIVAGANATFPSEASHFTALEKLISELNNESKRKVTVRPIEKLYSSDTIKEGLRKPPVHLAYFFCHAAGGPNTQTRLIFQPPPPSIQEPIKSAEFGGLLDGANKWEPPALVFLNGCRTANYSPEAVSPFLRSFVDQLGASGIVGTEITVWDVFAAEVGLEFLRQFLKCVPVGEALLRVRRILLSKMNPLGLVYSLYAKADLQLKCRV